MRPPPGSAQERAAHGVGPQQSKRSRSPPPRSCRGNLPQGMFPLGEREVEFEVRRVGKGALAPCPPCQRRKKNGGHGAKYAPLPTLRSYPRCASSSACGVSMSRKAPWPSTGTSATASLCLAIKWRAPISPSSVINSLKKRRDHNTGLPRRFFNELMTLDGDI